MLPVQFTFGVLVLTATGCRPSPPPSYEPTETIDQQVLRHAHESAPAAAERITHEREAIAALRTVNVGDSYDVFKQKTVAAHTEKRDVIGSGSGRVERYVLVDDDTKSFTLYLSAGMVTDFLAVGFDMGK